MPVSKHIGKLFNRPEIINPAANITVRDISLDLPQGVYPKINDQYYFDPVLVKKLIRFFYRPIARKNLLLIGDTGVGKSSLIEQFAARLNWPVYAIACSGRMRLQHFVGSVGLIGGNTIWQDGPLSKAMRAGGVFLADEITRLDHSEQMALAKVLDSGIITIPETGEVVIAHDSFRFVATGNSGGFGDESGAYNGERVSSVAFLDRFQKLVIDYMPAEDEINLLESLIAVQYPNSKLERSLLTSMVQLAGDIRSAFVGRGGDMRTVISTRGLCVWALEANGYIADRIGNSPLDEAMCDTILNGCPANERLVITTLWNKLLQ